LVDILKFAGLEPIIPEGGFFIIADITRVTFPDKYLKESTPAAPVMTRDWAFCRFVLLFMRWWWWWRRRKGATTQPIVLF